MQVYHFIARCRKCKTPIVSHYNLSPVRFKKKYEDFQTALGTDGLVSCPRGKSAHMGVNVTAYDTLGNTVQIDDILAMSNNEDTMTT